MLLPIIIDSHYVTQHAFADDLQLQKFTSSDKIPKLLPSMQSCIRNIKSWGTAKQTSIESQKDGTPAYCLKKNITLP